MVATDVTVFWESPSPYGPFTLYVYALIIVGQWAK